MTFDERDLRRNQIAYYLSRIDFLALIIVGVISIWLKNGMDLAQILLLQGIFGLFVLLMEFPSGVLADVTSRKNLLGIAYLSQVIGISFYLIGDSFAIFAIAEFFFAIYIASRSGSDTAAIYDSYAMLDREVDGEESIATGRILSLLGVIVLTSLGGWMSAISIPFTLIIAMCFVFIQSIVYFISIEPDRIKSDSSSKAMKMALGKLSNPGVIKILFASLFGAIFLKIAFWDYLPKISSLGLEEWTYGVVLAGANLVALITSMVVKKYKSLQDNLTVFAVLGTIGLILYVIADSIIFVFVAIALHQINRGGYNISLVINLNREASTDIRASVHSLISSIGFGSYFLLTIIFFIMTLGQQQILWFNLIGATVICLVIIVFKLAESTDQSLSTTQPSFHD